MLQTDARLYVSVLSPWESMKAELQILLGQQNLLPSPPGQWIIYLIVDKPKMSGSQDLLINHSLEGLEGNHRQALEPLKSRFVSWCTAEWDYSLNTIPQHIIQPPCVQSSSQLVRRLPLTNLPKLQKTLTWTEVMKATLFSRWRFFCFCFLNVTLIKMECERTEFTAMHWWTFNRQMHGAILITVCSNTGCWIKFSSFYLYILGLFWALKSSW